MPNLLGSLQIKGFQAKELPCWKALLSERGAWPQTPKIHLHCLSWCRLCCAATSALYPHETEFRTDLKHLWWERQLTFPTAYSSLQFFKHTISNMAQNKGTSSHAAWAPKHTRLPLKCSMSSLKGSITKTPKSEMSHTAGHRAELFWKLAFLWDLSGVPI